MGRFLNTPLHRQARKGTTRRGERMGERTGCLEERGDKMLLARALQPFCENADDVGMVLHAHVHPLLSEQAT